jgi:hypothetical protein
MMCAASSTLGQSGEGEGRAIQGVYRSNTMPGSRFLYSPGPAAGTGDRSTITRSATTSTPAPETRTGSEPARAAASSTNTLLTDGNVARVKPKRPAPGTSSETVITRDGESERIEQRFISGDGRVIERSTVVTREDDTETRTSQTRTGSGRVLSSTNETIVRDGDSTTRSIQTTRADGTKVEREITSERRGDSIVRTETTVTPARSEAPVQNGWVRSARPVEPVAECPPKSFERRADERLRTDPTQVERVNGWMRRGEGARGDDRR